MLLVLSSSICYHSLNGLLYVAIVLAYLPEMLMPYHPSCSLKPACVALLSAPSIIWEKFGRHSFSFSYCLEFILPLYFQTMSMFKAFKCGLKTQCFKEIIMHVIVLTLFLHLCTLFMFAIVSFIVVLMQQIELASTLGNVLNKFNCYIIKIVCI